ncbi:PDGLE domain-containing protein [Nocardioides sp. GY 10113]|uniref:PDGLE domain-containing protein n=1 Tax=Nocardioides sp. GY 10113 TaxID=2569761 RepID=UPI0014589407|nr:PDGLE domain-containing protein [Nocardioides sp. GY 10113]
MRNRRFLVVGLLVTLLIAGVGSFYASSHPDGLEFVAERTGFLDSGSDSAAAGSPFADYSTTGVENERLGGGIAGVVGVLLVLGLGTGLFLVLRRRTPGDGPEGGAAADRDAGDRATADAEKG